MALAQTIPSASSVCPYVGLQPYTLADRDYFFGRKRDQEVIFSNLFSARLTILYGASGVGKSSVIQAGLLPLLQAQRRSAVAYFRDWQSPTFLHDLKVECLRAVKKVYPKPLLASPELALDELLSSLAEASHCTIYVTLDQFEELFQYHSEGATSFDSELASALNRDDINANFLLILRDDALSKLDRFRTRIANLLGNMLRLKHLDLASAEEAIRGPISVYNQRLAPSESRMVVEDSLVQAVLAQLRPSARAGGSAIVTEDADRIETPYLQLVLERLWHEETEHGSRTLRLETLERLGNADQIIRTHFDRVMGAFSDDERTLCANIFRFLVTPDRSKVAVSAAALSQLGGVSEAALIHVLEKLCCGASRVLRAVAAPEGGGSRYEIFHDVLAPAVLDWRARRIQEEQREEAKRQAAAEAARKMEEEQQRQQEKVRQAKLAAARMRRTAITLAAGVLLSFVVIGIVGRLARSEEKARKAAQALAESESQSRIEAQGLAASEKGARQLAEIAMARARTASITAQKAEEAAHRLAASRRLTQVSLGNAVSNLDSNPERSILWVLEAMPRKAGKDELATNQTTDALRRTLEASRVLLTISPYADRPKDIVFSPDGGRMVTANTDGTARMWDATSGRELLAFYGHADEVTAVAFSPDGRLLATASLDGRAKIWDAKTGRELHTLSGHLAGLTTIAFGGANLLATGSEDGTAKVWDVSSGNLLHSLAGHWGAVRALAFSKDGKRLVTVGTDKKAIFWEVASGHLAFEIPRPSDIMALAFSPDGDQVVFGDWEGKVSAWDSRSGRHIKELSKFSSPVLSIAFNREGTQIAAAGYETQVTVWDSDSGHSLYVLAGHDRPVSRVVFSRDGSRIATASWDRTAKLWSTTARGEVFSLPHAGRVNAVAYSDDGKFLATASSDRTLKLWDAASGKWIRTLRHEERVLDVAFSPNGEWIATASGDKTVKLWDRSSGRVLCSTERQLDAMAGVVFSRDGRQLATSGNDGIARVWDAATCKQVQLLPYAAVASVAFSSSGILAIATKDGAVNLWDPVSKKKLTSFNATNDLLNLAFNPDGDRLAIASMYGTVEIWDIADPTKQLPPKRLATLSAHGDYVTAVTFSPDGRELATGSLDKTVKLWDVASGDQLQTITRGVQEVKSLQFSPDGERLAVAGSDSSARIYTLSLDELRKLARTHVNVTLSDEECAKYLKRPCREDAPHLVAQARALAQLFKFEPAVEKFRQALAVDPTLPFDAKTETEKIMAASALSSANYFVANANPQSPDKDIDLSLRLLQRAVEFDPTVRLYPEEQLKRLVANRLFHRARDYAEQGKLEEARRDLTLASQLDPTLIVTKLDVNRMVAQAHLFKAWDMKEQRRPKDAISELEQATTIDISYPITHKALAISYTEAGEYDKAIDQLHQALKINPEPELIFQLAELYSAKGDSGRALELAQEGVQAYPEYRCGYMSLGVIHYGKEEYDESIKDFQKIKDTDFCFERAITSISVISFDKKKDYELAYQVYRQVIVLSPNDAGNIANLAEASMATRRYEDASTLADRALLQRPDLSIGLAMRFVRFAALTLQDQKEAADGYLKAFVEFYNSNVTSQFKSRWSYTGSENFVANDPSISAEKRSVLLKLLAAIQKPAGPIKVEDFY